MNIYDGGDDINFIYIIDPAKYRVFLEKGISKYLLKLLKTKYKARKIDQISRGDYVIGHVCGLNLQKLNYEDQEDMEAYISNIKDLIDDEYSYLYIEESLPLDIKRAIGDRLSIDLCEGREIRLYNIPYIIKALKSKWKDDIIKEEILIVSSDKDEVLKMIYSICDEFSFISVLALNDEDGQDVYEKVLDDLGISIYYPNRVNVSLKRYGLIINLEDDVFINLDQVKNKTIVIDFSERKPFSKVNRYVIEDISIDISDFDLDDNPWIGKEICSDLSKAFSKGSYKEFNRIYKDNELLTIIDFLNQSLKIKGGY